jgi:hypothetical protein
MINPEPVAQIEFTFVELRAIFATTDGRQYVVDNDGNRVYGIWFIPPPDAECDQPIIVHIVPV